MLHPSCNMVCSFCVTEDSFAAMTFEQAVELLHTLKAIDIHNIVFGGGEPFTWEHDLVRLTEIAKQMDFLVQVGTNGIGMPANFERLPSIDRYCLPLESADPKRHNSIRLYKGEHHSIIIERLEALQQTRKSVTISTVIHQENLDGLQELGYLLRDYHEKSHNIHAWHLYKFIPEGRGGRPNADRLSISGQTFDRIVAELKQMNLGFTIYKRRDMFQSRSVGFFWYLDDQLKSTWSQLKG